MNLRKHWIAAAMIGASILGVILTITNVGVAKAADAEGVSLREESARANGFFAHYRSHRGGGLHDGK